MSRSLDCPRCSGRMEPGYIVDDGHGTKCVPQKSIWTGLKLRGKEKLEVATYRCRRCGYFEGYA